MVAYGFSFIALAGLAQSRPVVGGVCGGLAVAFHPVVGAWMGLCAVAGLLAQELIAFVERKRFTASEPSDGAECRKVDTRFAWQNWIGGGAACVAIAALGLVPAVQTIMNSKVSPEAAMQADVVQVYHRLGHHLNPIQFKQSAFAAYGLMLAVWLLGGSFLGRVGSLFQSANRRSQGSEGTQSTQPTLVNEPADCFWASCVLASVCVAGVGIWVGFAADEIKSIADSAWHTRFLKLYPFRLADLLVPIALSITVTSWLLSPTSLATSAGSEWRRNGGRKIAALAVAALLFALTTTSVDRNPSRMKPQRLDDWLAACEWIRANTPADAVVHTPRESFAFKWFAERAEVFSRKDCPQDSSGILEWYRRWHGSANWERISERDDQYSEEELAELAEQWQADYVILAATTDCSRAPSYNNASYIVVSCRTTDQSSK